MRLYFSEAALEYLLYVFIAALGILFRYNLGLTQSCKVVGKSISDDDTTTGFQDAITPPESTTIALVTWAAIVVALGYTIFQFGWWAGGVAFAVFLVVSALAGVTCIPKPESSHYLGRIYRAIVDRYTDFQENGDTMHAAGMKLLIMKMQAHYGDKLTEREI